MMKTTTRTIIPNMNSALHTAEVICNDDGTVDEPILFPIIAWAVSDIQSTSEWYIVQYPIDARDGCDPNCPQAIVNVETWDWWYEDGNGKGSESLMVYFHQHKDVTA